METAAIYEHFEEEKDFEQLTPDKICSLHNASFNALIFGLKNVKFVSGYYMRPKCSLVYFIL